MVERRRRVLILELVVVVVVVVVGRDVVVLAELALAERAQRHRHVGHLVTAPSSRDTNLRKPYVTLVLFDTIFFFYSMSINN